MTEPVSETELRPGETAAIRFLERALAAARQGRLVALAAAAAVQRDDGSVSLETAAGADSARPGLLLHLLRDLGEVQQKILGWTLRASRAPREARPEARRAEVAPAHLRRTDETCSTRSLMHRLGRSTLENEPLFRDADPGHPGYWVRDGGEAGPEVWRFYVLSGPED